MKGEGFSVDQLEKEGLAGSFLRINRSSFGTQNSEARVTLGVKKPSNLKYRDFSYTCNGRC